ncbi:alpha-lytic protease prodomain-containing protein, partial [Streptomyces daliensis]|nr:alpha-lytic protease prodomain-containing protein [Streptomyces daliensis]
QAAEAVRKTGAVVRTVEHTAKELNATKKRVDALSAPSGVASWHVDPEANRVVVDVVADDKDDKAVRA